jgi:RNase H-like domain found in reverse transcriptase
MHPLQQLVKSKRQVSCTKEAPESFGQVKRNLLKYNYLLSNLITERKIAIKCMASNIGVGAVLLQYTDRSEVFISALSETKRLPKINLEGIYSYQLKSPELNYSVLEKELFGIYKSLNQFSSKINSGDTHYRFLPIIKT